MIVASIRIAVLDLSELELTNGARLAVGMSQSTTWVRDPRSTRRSEASEGGRSLSTAEARRPMSFGASGRLR